MTGDRSNHFPPVYCVRPKPLQLLGNNRIKQFIDEFDQYKANGGSMEVSSFIDEDLLKTIKNMYIFNPLATNDHILQFLRNRIIEKLDFREKFQYLNKNVKIHPDAAEGDEKLVSLFTSLTKALRLMDMTDKLPFKKKKELLMKALPKRFVADLEAYEFTIKVSENENELWKACIEVNKGYDWVETKSEEDGTEMTILEEQSRQWQKSHYLRSKNRR